MICDEVKPNCLVIACCSERCVEVNNVIEDNQRMVKTSHEYAYGNMRKNEYCPVCHTQLFSYSISDRFENEVKPSKVVLHCIYCHSNYELIRTKDDWLIYDFRIPKYFNTTLYNNIKPLKDIMIEAK